MRTFFLDSKLELEAPFAKEIDLPSCRLLASGTDMKYVNAWIEEQSKCLFVEVKMFFRYD